MSPTDTVSLRPRAFWREHEFTCLLVLVALVFLPRLAEQTIRGEESRWATVAQHMLATGDYIVPRQQGLPFPDRPPLHCWSIAACMAVLGPDSLWALRLPSVLAMLGSCTLIYGYGRRFLSPWGALGAGAAFATMLQVMQLGRLAESDALFTCLLASSLLIWHALYLSDRSRLLMWSVGYSLAALAALTKGPQAPVYFVGVTGCYLLLVRRDWRTLVSWQHLCGGFAFLLLLGSWQLPLAISLGWDGVEGVWTEEGHLQARLIPKDLAIAARHWLTYPFKILAATLPWSLLLACYFNPRVRNQKDGAQPYVVYLVTCLLVTLPTVWYTINSVTRYFVPLFPCLALLIGLALERSVVQARATWWPPTWQRFRDSAIGVIAFAAIALIGVAQYHDLIPGLTSSPGWTLLFTVGGLSAASILWLSRTGAPQGRGGRVQVLALAGFIGLAYLSLGLSVVIGNSTNPSADVERVKQILPDDARLVSFGRVHHLFAYYYQQAIPQLPALENAAAAEGVEYFCFAENREDPIPVTIPFEWERVLTVSCDRARRADPIDRVVIGRRRVSTPVSSDARVERVASPQPSLSGPRR